MSGPPARKILLLSYHYPPSEATGALRWQKLTMLGAARGWSVEAVSLAAEQAGRIDPRRVEALPAGTRIHGVATDELPIAKVERSLLRLRDRVRLAGARSNGGGPAAASAPARPGTIPQEEVRWLAGSRGLIRAYNVLLDHAEERSWCRKAAAIGLRQGRLDRPDLIVTCGPPHLIHDFGRRLARELGVAFVMDLRDPWSLQVRLPEDLASPLWYRMAARYERRCVDAAALVVMNTANAEAAMRRRWPAANVISVMNGWDDEPLPTAPWPDQFRVLYAGSIYLDRSPRPWFLAVAQAVRALGVTPEQFEVRLIGAVDSYGGSPVRQIAADAGVDPYVRIMPPVSRSAILGEYAEAAVLLSLPQDSETAIPSKIFEYARQPAWLLAQVTPRSATGMLLQGTPATILAPDDVQGAAEFLIDAYRRFRRGERPEPIAREGRWSRASEGGRLFDALEAIAAGKTGPR